MIPKKLTAFRLAPEMVAGLQAIKDRDGIPITEQVRRAIATWLRAKNRGKESKRKK